MIRTLKLTNFMKHESLELVFGEGLQIVKGSNEAGKSSMLLGISYAFFGSKALRTTFADAVHHGKPESSLKVELELDLAGHQLLVTRGKSGAEVIEGGKVIVTGQTEVTNYLTGLLGADANAASKLMVASQGNLRGALEQGPKAMSQMIEELAGMSVFETLIEAMQEKLMLGNTAVIESQVAAAEATLEGMTEPVAPDLASAATAIAAMESEAAAAEASANALFKADEAAALAVAAAEKRVDEANRLAQRIAEAETESNRLRTKAEQLQVAMPEHDLAAQREKIAEAKNHAEIAQAFSNFSAVAYPSDYWEGLKSDFDEAWAAAKRQSEAASRAEQEASTQVKLLQQSKVTASICGFCGQDFTSLPEIAAKNAAIDNAITAAQGAANAAAQAKKQADAECFAYAAIDKLARPIEAAALRLERYVVADRNLWPPRLAWVGPEVTADTPDVKAMERDLASMGAEIKAAESAAAQRLVVESNLKDALQKLTTLRDELGAFVDVDGDLKAAQSAKSATHEDWSAVYQRYSALSVEVGHMRQQRDEAERAYNAAKLAWGTSAAALKEKRALLADMRFNNALLKKVRAARPIITDKLWSLVLASVSNSFSRMRGEASVVAKGKDGFMVNGAAVESLSGSTLDLLGLSLRTSLTRTFIPHSPFLVLDEPFAACDTDRAMAMLGFIKASGFSQTILVTHDEISESVADNLVEL